MPRQPRWNVQVRHGEYRGTKETVNICTHSLCFRSPNLPRPHTSRAAQQAMGEVQSRRDWRKESPEAVKIRNRLGGSSAWCAAIFCGGGCGPWETARVITSHPTSLLWKLPDSYKGGGLPVWTLIKKHKHTNLSLSLLVCGTRTPPQSTSLA